MRKLLVASALIPCVLWASESEEVVEPSWKGKAELGFVSASGNTETSSTNGKINLLYEGPKWRQEIRLEVLQAESEVIDSNNQKVTQKTADRTYGLSKTDYKYSEKSYAYALVDYADENFTDKDYIGNFSIGYGRTLIKEKDQELHGEFGYGLRRYQFKEEYIANEDEVARLAGRYFTTISDNAKFSQELVAEFGKDFDVYKSVTALTVNINSSMAMSVGYEAVHTTEVDEAAGIEKTDSKTTINFVYNFL